MLSQWFRPWRWLQVFVIFSMGYYLFHQYKDPSTWRERGVPFEPRSLKVGDTLPHSLVLPSCHGEMKTLKDLGGPLHILVFWASWCHTCIQEFSEFEHLLKKMPQIRLILVQVDGVPGRTQSPAVLKPYRDQITTLCDPKGLLAEAFDVSALPHAFVLGRNHDILHVQLGDGAWTSRPMLERLRSWLPEVPSQKPPL
jgi:thiol-disulfide isomerase/thioredoxin